MRCYYWSFPLSCYIQAIIKSLQFYLQNTLQNFILLSICTAMPCVWLSFLAWTFEITNQALWSIIGSPKSIVHIIVKWSIKNGHLIISLYSFKYPFNYFLSFLRYKDLCLATDISPNPIYLSRIESYHFPAFFFFFFYSSLYFFLLFPFFPHSLTSTWRLSYIWSF